jgi:hypothetical protein
MGDEPKEVEQPSEGSLKQADKEVGPNIVDAELEDPPVRAVNPGTPILQTLKVGAGAHQPRDTDDENFDADGRYIGPVPGTRATTEASTRSTATSKSASTKETR